MSIWKATTQSEMSEREIRHMDKVRRFAAEGMVLLDNDGTLPFEASTRKIALFGNGARHMVKGGKGSGDVNSRSIVDVEQGIREAGCEIVSTAWLDAYDWGTTGGVEMGDNEHKYGSSNAADCVRAGNDPTMPGSEKDVRKILDDGVTRAEHQACARRILECVLACRY